MYVCAYVCCMYVVFLLWGDVYCASGERKAQERKYVSMFVVCLSVVCLSVFCILYFVFCILYSVCMHVRMYVVCMYYVRCERKDVCILPGARSLTVVCGSLVRSPWGDVCSVCVYVGCAYVCSM